MFKVGDIVCVLLGDDTEYTVVDIDDEWIYVRTSDCDCKTTVSKNKIYACDGYKPERLELLRDGAIIDEAINNLKAWVKRNV